jgi:hypothetical protein
MLSVQTVYTILQIGIQERMRMGALWEEEPEILRNLNFVTSCMKHCAISITREGCRMVSVADLLWLSISVF